MLDFVTRNADLATPGTLKAKGRTYHAQTIVELRNDLISRAQATIAALQAHKKGAFKAPMGHSIRNGFVVKIGYGKKNEFFRAGEERTVLIPELPFATDRKFAALAYLEDAIAATNAGEFDAMLEAKQAEYKKRFAIKLAESKPQEPPLLPSAEPALQLVANAA